MPADILQTSRLTIKTLTEHCADRVLEYLIENREFHKPWVPVPPENFYTLEKQRDLIIEEKKNVEAGSKYRFYIMPKGPENIIGHFSFSNIVRGPFQSCHTGYSLSKNYTGQGFMHEALSEGIRFVFQTLKLHRIEANIIPTNERSIKMIERLGFERIGLAKNYLQINSIWQDHIQYQLINHNESIAVDD